MTTTDFSIIDKITTRLRNMHKLKMQFISEGKKAISLTPTVIKNIQSEYRIALNRYLPKTYSNQLPVLFYINDKQHITHMLDIYESEDGWLEAIIPINPKILNAVLIGQIATQISLGQQHLISNQSEASGKITRLTIEADYYIDLATADNLSNRYQLEPGAMVVFNNVHGTTGEWLIVFKL